MIAILLYLIASIGFKYFYLPLYLRRNKDTLNTKYVL